MRKSCVTNAYARHRIARPMRLTVPYAPRRAACKYRSRPLPATSDTANVYAATTMTASRTSFPKRSRDCHMGGGPRPKRCATRGQLSLRRYREPITSDAGALSSKGPFYEKIRPLRVDDRAEVFAHADAADVASL